MARLAALACLAMVLTLLLAQRAVAAEQPSHDRAYWLELRARQFEVPQSKPILPLALEATRLLGSTDPQLRDAVAYEALEMWIYRNPRLSPSELDTVREALSANARRGLGKTGGDDLYLRSFSVLVLSVVAAADLKQSFLDQSQFDALVDLALDALAQERDLRGYTDKGWAHATAHCADLLKFLSRSPKLQAAQQARIVAGIAERLRSAGLVFVWGEDARLAAALTSVARRADADPAPFESWFGRLTQEHQAVWNSPLDPPKYVAVRAQLNALSELSANLEADSAPGALQAIRSALRKLRTSTS